MKIIDTNKLNRFWKNGVKPIADSVAKKLDTSKVINNLLTTKAGYALDARQGKVLQDQVSEINSNLGELNTGLSNVRNYTIYYDRQDFSLKTLLNTLYYELQKLTATTAFTATLQSGVVYGVYGYYTPDTGSGVYGAMHIIQYGNDICHTWYASIYGGVIKISDELTTPTLNSTIS